MHPLYLFAPLVSQKLLVEASFIVIHMFVSE